MNKKIIGFNSIVQLFLSAISYLALAYHFETDEAIMEILANTDWTATLLRLCIYIIPSINLVSGMFGIIFSNKKLLAFVMLLEIWAGHLMIRYSGNNGIIAILGLLMFMLAIVDLLCLITYDPKKDKKKKQNKKK